jgi:hypothetical protein
VPDVIVTNGQVLKGQHTCPKAMGMATWPFLIN